MASGLPTTPLKNSIARTLAVPILALTGGVPGLTEGLDCRSTISYASMPGGPHKFLTYTKVPRGVEIVLLFLNLSVRAFSTSTTDVEFFSISYPLT